MEKRSRGQVTEPAVADADEQVADRQPDTDTSVLDDLTHADVADAFADPAEGGLYGRLAAPFDVTFRDLRAGVELEYITGEQATTRLNETLGFLNWSFRVLEHGIHAEADECWVLGELTVMLDGRTATRQQFGSQSAT